MAGWLYNAAQATLSFIRTPHAHENLRQYARAAILPEMRLSPQAPSIPSPEKPGRVNHIHGITLETHRSLESMDAINEFDVNARECECHKL